MFWQTDSKNCYSFLSRGSRIPDMQRLVLDIKCRERRLDVNIVPVWTPRSQARSVESDLGYKMASSTDEWCIDREDLGKVFLDLSYAPDFDCMATRKNAICQRFYSKIPQIGTAGVNFLSQELQPGVLYYCCPPVRMIGRVVCHLLEKENIQCLLIVPGWTSMAFWSALSESEKFRCSIVRE